MQQVLPRVTGLLADPARLAPSVAGAIALDAAYVAALWFAAQAFGTHASLGTVAAIYLAGTAVSAASPTPGGLGAIEIAFSAGLTAAGMPGANAVSAVLLYRLATFWLPVPLGWAALRWLQKHEAV
jgi:uncharacterized protein (TIRG00374 family)